MKYGSSPKFCGQFSIDCKEMMFYQYLPIKMLDSTDIKMEPRLNIFRELVGKICCDFIAEYGLTRFVNSYAYLTAKRQFVSPGNNMNREGWHCDGFMTDDINYIWSDCIPTVFCIQPFNLTQDDTISIQEMNEQAKEENFVSYGNNGILRLNQYQVHKCADIDKPQMRTFIKVSFSPDKYNLEGNSHNYMFDYEWEMQKRKIERNIPQVLSV